MKKLFVQEYIIPGPTDVEELEGNYHPDEELDNEREVLVDPDEHDREEGKTAVDLTVRELEAVEATEPCSVLSCDGITFRTPDTYTDKHTGDSSYTVVLLRGFSPEEIAEVRRRVR